MRQRAAGSIPAPATRQNLMDTTQTEMLRIIAELARLLDIAMGAEGDCLAAHWNDATDAMGEANSMLSQFVDANKKVNK